MTDHERSQLTPDGEARREAMLGELVGAMQRVHHGRRIRRRVASASALVAIFAGLAWVIGSQLSVGDPARPQFVERPQQPVPDAPTNERLIQMLDDDQLVALLAQLDRPAGIVRSEGEIWLTNAVTDAELGLTPPQPPDPSTM
ncbi:MAG: hypothetical protein IIA64_12395 [Planctomycetes bacterium]|nr:hypothetical protein [Planctomycetota bacterium]